MKIPKRGEYYHEGNMGHFPPIFKVMAVVDGYVVYRKKGCHPAIKSVKKFVELYPFQADGY